MNTTANNTNELTHALSFDIEDWFHMVDIASVEDPETWSSLPTIVEQRTDEILEICDEFDVKATFFVLGWIADRYPELIRRIADQGHELGSHSYWHRRVYKLTPDEFTEDLRRSIAVIEDAGGVSVSGFRAPSFSIIKGTEWAFDVMHDCGIKYDASLFPARRGHGGYDCPVNAHMFEQAPGGIAMPELPMSVARFAGKRICFSGGGYLRLLPQWMIARGIDQLADRKIPSVIYLHPRDFATDCPRVAMPLHRRFKSYFGIASTAKKLKRLLQRNRWSTCLSVLEDQLGISIS